MSVVINKLDPRTSQPRAVELTDILVELPRNISIIDALGLFEDVPVSQKTVEIQRAQYSNHLVKDKNWDDKADTLVNKPKLGFIHARVPHFSLRDAISPSDVDGVFSVNSVQEAAGLEQVSAVRVSKLDAMNSSLDLTQDIAKMQLLTAGTVYAPAGTLATSYGDTIDFYQEFGITRQTVDLKLSGANDPRVSVSSLIRKMREALRNSPSKGSYRQLVVLCGSDFFDAVLTNPFATDAIKYFQQDLNKLLVGVPDTAAGYGPDFRSIQAWGVVFIDAGTGGYDGPDGVFVPWIAADAAIALPTGVRGMFKSFHAPANTFTSINKASKGRYARETINEEDNLIKLTVEHNFMNACLYPGAIFTVTKS